MSTFQYGSPARFTPEERPRCWGDEQVRDPLARECRVCPTTNSCGEQIVRIRNNRLLASNTVGAPQQPQNFGVSYFAQFAPPQMQNPLPQQPQMMQQPRPVQPMQPQPVPIQPQQLMPARPFVPQFPQPPTVDRYGWIQDPLYHTIAACPPPPRPQFAGENFVTRVGKNILLDMAESFLKQCLFGVRQLVLPPNPFDPNDGSGGQ